MPGGGKRAGAGRPRKLDTHELYVSFKLDTCQKLKSMIPRGHRSEFVSDCVESALRMRELLNECRGQPNGRLERETAADFFWSEMNEPATNSFDLPGAHQVPVNNHNIIQ